MDPETARLERFVSELDALVAPDARIGVAVSGGSDSLALLVLAAAARPGRIEAATVDHALRPESRAEAEAVSALCGQLAIPHAILTAEWREPPVSAIQERARTERYRLLAGWIEERALGALVTAHHLDDQAETLLMRLTRGAGVRGLAAMRPRALVPGASAPLLRPLLGWRKAQLAQVCAAAGLMAAHDPSNDRVVFERVRVRRALSDCDLLDPQALAASAAYLREADEALEWASRKAWDSEVFEDDATLIYRVSEAPAEIRRRIVARAVSHLATEGQGSDLRGRELDRLLAVLLGGGSATIRGVRCAGGAEWRFTKAPPRRG